MAEVIFVGVSTEGSLVHLAMPLWQPLLPASCGIRGVDLPLDAADHRYRDLLGELERDVGVAGAVVTSHKVRLFEVARDRFAYLDPTALACEEVNAVRRTASGLNGFARDPVSVGRVVDAIWPPGEGEVICLGAGGTARALAFHLARTRDPVEFVCAEPDPHAIADLARLVPGEVVSHTGEGPWDELVAGAPPRSLIVNATGLGKDRPGSPLSEGARFPPRAVAWELNYRGDLRFLGQAREAARVGDLDVHDGWRLLCHGWAAALAAVLDLTDDPGLGDRFADAADVIRPAPG